METSPLRVVPVDEGLEVAAARSQPSLTLSWRWLADHGEDEQSRDPHTGQRRVDTFSIDPHQAGKITVSDEAVTVDWASGSPTTISLATLEAVVADYAATPPPANASRPPRLADDLVLWSNPEDPEAAAPPELAAEAFLGDDDGFASGVDTLCRFGYLVLRGDGSPAAVDRGRAGLLADRIGYVRHTIFGGIWDLSAELTDHADTAYTHVYLGPHTDGTYSHDAPGLQFFQCLRPADEGGESLLVDGFAIVGDLLAGDEADRRAAETLASVVVPGEYLEPGVHLRAERPVLRCDHRDVLQQVSFNNYDRSPFVPVGVDQDTFYEAYGRFAELANEPGRRAAITLESGDFLIFDNWRCLHGRNAFSGARHYVGAYLNHEDLESKRRLVAAG